MRRSLECLAALALLGASPATAATWHVPQDAATIAGALALTAPGDSVVVACGTYLEHDIVLAHAVTLVSETGNPDCVTIDAGSAGRVLFSEEPLGDARIEGLTLTGGQAEGTNPWTGWGGGALFLGAAPVLERCVFAGNRATGGGGLAIGGHGTPIVDGCTFDGNSAEDGGGVYLTVTDATLSGCTFIGNLADSSGGGVVASLGTVTITGSTFHGNGAPEGGSLSAGFDQQCSVDTSILAFGSVGEAVACDGTSSATLGCCDVFGNTGGDWVGALAGQDGTNGNFAEDPLFCDAAARNLGLAPASPCLPGNHPDGAACGLIGAHPLGCGGTVGAPAPGAATAVRLTARPTPFRDSVRLDWALADSGPARIRIFDVKGRLVRAFDASGSGGSVRWDARTETGRRVAAGAYFVRLDADGRQEVRRVVYLR